MNDDKKVWELSIGFYPGVVVGMRSYHDEETTSHVFYLPFIDFCFQVEN
jgi:hypothetical protein